MTAVIIAGGKGTRLSAITGDDIPKSMVMLCGKPIIEHQIEALKKSGVSDIIIICGYLHEKIVDYLGDGVGLGVNISYLIEPIPLGTGGGLYLLKGRINDTFLMMYGDIIFDIDAERMVARHKEAQAAITLLLHPNSHPYDSDIVQLDDDSMVKGFDSKHNKRDYWYNNAVNAGFFVCEPTILSDILDMKKIDLEKDVLLKLCEQGKRVLGYRSPEYVKDVGTPERLSDACGELERGIVSGKNLKNKQKCIFLDRDGTVNRYAGLICKQEELQLEERTPEAIRLINRSGYLCVVITNQPVIARGMCSLAELDNIHRKLETLLGNKGAYLDDIIYCPHHPDKGYPEEVSEYKIECSCRKPNIGMITQAVERYNIDAAASWFVGDTTMDIETGKNAGMKTALVKTGMGGSDDKYHSKPDIVCEDLLEAIQMILWKEGAHII